MPFESSTQKKKDSTNKDKNTSTFNFCPPKIAPLGGIRVDFSKIPTPNFAKVPQIASQASQAPSQYAEPLNSISHLDFNDDLRVPEKVGSDNCDDMGFDNSFMSQIIYDDEENSPIGGNYNTYIPKNDIQEPTHESNNEVISQPLTTPTYNHNTISHFDFNDDLCVPEKVGSDNCDDMGFDNSFMNQIMYDDEENSPIGGNCNVYIPKKDIQEPTHESNNDNKATLRLFYSSLYKQEDIQFYINHLGTLEDNQLSPNVFNYYVKNLPGCRKVLTKCAYSMQTLQSFLEGRDKLQNPKADDIIDYICKYCVGFDSFSLAQSIRILKGFFDWTASTKKPNGKPIYPNILSDMCIKEVKKIMEDRSQPRNFGNQLKGEHFDRYINIIEGLQGEFKLAKQNLIDFKAFLRQSNKLQNPKADDILDYARTKLNNVKPWYISQFVQSIRGFFEWTNITQENDLFIYPNIAYNINGAKIKKELNEVPKSTAAEFDNFIEHKDYERYIEIIKDQKQSENLGSSILRKLEDFLITKGRPHQPQKEDLYEFAQTYWSDHNIRRLSRDFIPIRSFFEWTATTRSPSGKFIYPNIAKEIVATELTK